MVQRATILPPQSQIGAVSDELRKSFLDYDQIGKKYDDAFDRESAYEILSRQFNQGGVAETQVVRPIPQAAEQQAAPAAAEPVYQPVAFRVYNPATGQYEEQSSPTLPQQPVYQQPVYPAAQPVQEAAREKPQKERKAAKKRSEMTMGEQLLDSFTKSATTSAGRQLGSSLTRSLLGMLGINNGRRR